MKPVNTALIRYFHSTVVQRNVKPFMEIPGPKKFPVIGNLNLFSKFGPYSFDRIADAWMDLHDKYGPLVKLNVGEVIVSTSSADDVRTIFSHEGKYPERPNFGALEKYRKNNHQSLGIITGSGEEWYKLRRAVNWILHPKSPGEFTKDQNEVADKFIARIRNIRDKDMIVHNFLHELYLFTEESIGVVIFGKKLGILQQTTLGKKLMHYVDDLLYSLSRTLLGLPLWKIWKTSDYKRIEASLNFMLSICQMHYDESKHCKFISKLEEDKNLSRSDVLVLMQEIFTGGIDATGNALCFLVYHLARDPSVQRLLYDEIVNISNEINELSQLQNLRYLSACIKESFRLTPTAGGNARILASDAILSGYLVPAGTLCVGNNKVLGISEEYFNDPESFQPNRWLRTNDRFSNGAKNVDKTSIADHEDSSKINPFTILPFGHGPRKCVGQRLAEQEMKLCIIKLFQNFEVKPIGTDKIGTLMRMQYLPDRPLNFQFIDRKK